MLKTALILFLLVLFPLVGLGVVLSSIQMLDTADTAEDWPTMQGKILTSQLLKEQIYSRTGPSSSRRTPIDVYSAQVKV